MKTVDVGAVLDEGAWGGYQKALVAAAALAIVFDGLDNQVLSGALPAIMRDWNVPRSALTPAMIAWLCERAPEALVIETGGASVRLATASMLSSDDELDAFAADGVAALMEQLDRDVQLLRDVADTTGLDVAGLLAAVTSRAHSLITLAIEIAQSMPPPL